MAALFNLVSPFEPAGDQPKAIKEIVAGFGEGRSSQVLLGITGSGKTFTMAHVIQKMGKKTLILAHNKTLAGQLYQEFKEFFPHNAVEYFVSYYDYYQPEAYIARTDTYIEKDLAINEEIDRMRLSATRSLIARDDVIIIASVSCIYGLGSPEYFSGMQIPLKVGKEYRRDDLLLGFIELQYERNDFDLMRSTFRLRGEVIDIFPSYEEDRALRLHFDNDVLVKIAWIDPLTSKTLFCVEETALFPGSHHVTPQEVREEAMGTIKEELNERLNFFESEGKLLERQRLQERTTYDLEMIRSVGFCKGIENYSRHFSRRAPGSPPPCLLDYFPEDFLLIVDESHQTVPQLRAMYHGDRSRKEALVEYGFRLPSAFDNRPLKFEESYARFHEVLYVSATPDAWEVEEAQGICTEQIIRPTGLLDPVIDVRPSSTQVDDALHEISEEVKKKNRVLVTTMTKKLAEELTSYLQDLGVKANYLHADIDTLERAEILYSLRAGEIDVLVGINLLREGLDLPEVSLVLILDADRQGFLRSRTSLIQTCGRAARHEKGRVVMYADTLTNAIKETLEITGKRRLLQMEYNRAHGITPKSTKRALKELNPKEVRKSSSKKGKKEKGVLPTSHFPTEKELEKQLATWEKEMQKAASAWDFEEAARLRDLIKKWKHLLVEGSDFM